MTGFVGSHLAWRLLEHGHRVSALARGSKNTSARERVESVLRRAARSPERWQACAARLTVLESDLGLPKLGLDDNAWKTIASTTDEVWHCAASLASAEEEREDIFRINVGGTQRILEMAARTSSGRLHHVSTAYVAGVKGVATETEINTGQAFRNPYEESKCGAEQLVADGHAKRRVHATIYRPSIVMGDSHTGRATHFHGAYAFIRGLFTGAARLRGRLPPGATVHLPMRVLGRGDTTLNFVPIDYVVNAMLHIGGLLESFGKTYHLVNPEATPNTLWLPTSCRLLGVTGVEFVDQSAFERTPPTRLEALFQKRMAFYYTYLQGEPRFDCSRVLAALEGTGIECPRVSVELMEKMLGWYVEYLKAN